LRRLDFAYFGRPFSVFPTKTWAVQRPSVLSKNTEPVPCERRDSFFFAIVVSARANQLEFKLEFY